MAQVSARWYKIVVSETLQRSSQIAAVIRGKAYIFGGELRPREPRDNDVYVVDIAKGVVAQTLDIMESWVV